MGAGSRRHRISFERPVTTADPVTNEQVESWDVFKTVWAAAEDKPAKEFYENGQFHGRSLTTFECLSLAVAGADETMRISFGGADYNVVAIRKGTVGRNLTWFDAERVA